MNSRLCIVLFVSMAIVTVKGLPGLADGLWSKLATTSLQSSPVHHPFANQPNARSFPEAVPVQQPKEEPKKLKPEAELPKAKEATVPFMQEGPQLQKLHEAFAKHQKKQPKVQVKTRSDATSESGKPEVPIFAKLILGNPDHPQLATVENLRKIDWRSVATYLELPNKNTIPLVNELLQKTEELLRVFQELQVESNGFVEDVQKHNENGDKEYIGYYN